MCIVSLILSGCDKKDKNQQSQSSESSSIKSGTLKDLLLTKLTGMKRADATVERNQMMGVNMTVAQERNETETGYEKTITYKGYEVMEEYDNSTKEGGIRVFVADHFVVEESDRHGSSEEGLV